MNSYSKHKPRLLFLVEDNCIDYETFFGEACVTPLYCTKYLATSLARLQKEFCSLAQHYYQINDRSS